ncbi:hypothetical protein G7067_01980 [Leucobacter insecticola]|uniref:Uncharacterized protein n=1 Tax=Leucobacter insecticola TaxID=2714934 RepID=A0A6G8FG18_9MICO|nr:hypothetical protein [Leucobacter insecticola]QIM15456.1 hypothetical protein G7067_01980 [Leucobacter insecticola]
MRIADENEKWVIVLLVIATIVAVARYSEYVGEITVWLVVFSALVFLATVVAFLVFWVKKCVDGRSVVWRILLSSALWTAGLFNAYWLQNAPIHGEAVEVMRAYVAKHGAIGSFLQSKHGEFQQVANQMIGAGLCMLMLLVFMALCLAAISAVNIASGGRPRWFWLALFWLNKWATGLRVWIVAAFVGLLALAFTSGLAFDLGEAFIHQVSTLFPSSSLTPTPSP